MGIPLVLKHLQDTFRVEDVSAAQRDTWLFSEGLSVANAAKFRLASIDQGPMKDSRAIPCFIDIFCFLKANWI